MYRVLALKATYRWLALLLALGALLGTVAASDRVAPTSTPTKDTSVPLPIIMYHGLLEDPTRQGTYVLSPALLEQDLAYIRQAGYTPVVMADLLAYVREGTPLPEKPIMLTFDDGYYNNYAYAYPLLQQYGMRAVLSPVVYWSAFYSAHPEEADRVLYSHITWDQLREVSDSGVFEIQNHSYDMHKNQAGQRKGTLKKKGETVEEYRTRLAEDLTKAQELLAQQTGNAPTTFTYPFGAISREAREVLEKLGFSATLTCEGRVNRLTRDPECLWGLGRYLRPSGRDSVSFFDPIFRTAEAARTQ